MGLALTVGAADTVGVVDGARLTVGAADGLAVGLRDGAAEGLAVGLRDNVGEFEGFMLTVGFAEGFIEAEGKFDG